MKYKTLYGIHEGRMIVEKLVVPLIVGGLVFFSNEENKRAAKNAYRNAKNFVLTKVESFKSKKGDTKVEDI